MVTHFAHLIGGIGLFFLGMLLTDENMKVLLTHHVQTRLLRWTRNAWIGSIFGFTLGLITQGGIVVLLLMATFSVYSGVSLFALLPVVYWSNPAACIFLFFVFLNVKILMLYLIGIFGVIPFIHKFERFHTISKFILGISLIILGLSLFSEGSGELLKTPSIHAFFQHLDQMPLIGLFFIGACLTFFVQGDIVFLFTISLVQSQIISLEQSFIVICGEHLGAAAGIYTIFFFYKGIPKQVIMSHVFFNICASLLFPLLIAIDNLLGIKIITPTVQSSSADIGFQITFFILALNTIQALLSTLTRSSWASLIQTLFPIKKEEAERIQFPRYVSPLIRENISLADNAFIQEYTSIIKYLIFFLDLSKSALLDNKNKSFEIKKLDQALKELFKRLRHYLIEFQKQTHSPDISAMFLDIAYTLENLTYLEDSLADKAQYLNTTINTKKMLPKVKEWILALLEAEETILLSLYDTLMSRYDLELILMLNHNKQDIMQEVRSNILVDTSKENRSSIIFLTDLFTRETWLINQLCDFLKKLPSYSMSYSQPLSNAEPQSKSDDY